jgi:hypothetical protein
LEFSFYLADRLHMTVAELGERMSNAEFVQWAMWHARKAQRRELAEKVSKHRGR